MYVLRDDGAGQAARRAHTATSIVGDIDAALARRTSGYEVTYVHNFTDVDDQIIERANERGPHVP